MPVNEYADLLAEINIVEDDYAPWRLDAAGFTPVQVKKAAEKPATAKAQQIEADARLKIAFNTPQVKGKKFRYLSG